MKMNKRRASALLVAAMGLTLLGGCGKNGKADVPAMIDKYAGMCELGDYLGVEYVMTQTEITDDMVQSSVTNLLQQYATSEQVNSGTVANGDTVNIDYVGTIDGEEFQGGNSNGAGYDLTIGSGTILFEDDLIGHKVGETFDVDMTFPEDYGATEVAGKDAVFAVTINYMTKTTLPTYSDAFVASYTDAKTMAEYEQSVLDDLKEQYANQDKSYNKSAVMQVIVDNATVKQYPEQELQGLVDTTVSSVASEASQYGYDLTTYLAARYGIESEESFRTYVAGIVEDYIKEKIIVCAIAKQENLTITKDEIAAYKQKMMDSLNASEEEFDKSYTAEDVAYYTLADKVVEYVLERAVGVGEELNLDDAATE